MNNNTQIKRKNKEGRVDPTYIEKKKAGIAFMITFITTIVLLVSIVASLVVVMIADINGSNRYTPPSGSGGGSKLPGGTYTTTQGNLISGNVLFPTRPSRTSYVIGKASDVRTVSTEIKSGYSILVDLETMTSVGEKNADEKIYPASMTKVMTLIVACEKITDLSRVLTVTKEHYEYAQANGSSGYGLKEGEKITVEDALYLIGFESDGISCQLIAEYLCGSEAEFVKLMNKKAADIGCTATNFSNSSGLYDDNNYSTCRDIASIMAYALDNEMVMRVLSYKQPGEYGVRGFTFHGDTTQRYAFLEWYRSSSRFNKSPKLDNVTVMAGKTGYVDESGVSLVSYAEDKNGKKYINVTVGLPKGSGVTESVCTNDVKYMYNTFAK